MNQIFYQPDKIIKKLLSAIPCKLYSHSRKVHMIIYVILIWNRITAAKKVETDIIASITESDGTRCDT